MSANDGHFPRASWAGSASAVPYLAGLQRMAEVTAGRIDHVVNASIPRPALGAFRWSALRTDGWFTGPGATPEGTIFRLPAGYDAGDQTAAGAPSSAYSG